MVRIMVKHNWHSSRSSLSSSLSLQDEQTSPRVTHEVGAVLQPWALLEEE